MTRVALVLLVSASVGCASSNARFLRYQYPVSPLCELTLIHDLRTGMCLATYDCSWRTGLNGLTRVPDEVCEP